MNNPIYLYHRYRDIDGQTSDGWIAYRVLKTTDRFIYVDSHPCGSVNECGTVNAHRESDPDDKSWRIPRADLERDGFYTIKQGSWQDLYLRPEAIEAVQP